MIQQWQDPDSFLRDAIIFQNSSIAEAINGPIEGSVITTAFRR